MLFTNYYIALAANLADRIAVLRHGRMVELAATGELIAAPTTDYMHALFDAHLGLDA